MAGSDWRTETMAPRDEWDEHPATHAERPTGCLIGLTGACRGTRYVITGHLVIGRTRSCGLRIDRSEVSRRHAELLLDGGRYLLRDLGSRNGTFVNGDRVTERELAFGDRIAFGGHDLFLFTVHDRIHDQLIATQRLESLGRLAAGVAHDFRNVLAIIDGNARMLAPMCSHPEAAAMIEDVVLAAERGRELVRQLVSFASPSESSAEVDLTGLIGEVERLLRRLAGPSVTVEVGADAGLGTTGHRSQLFQALLNLCTNAVEAVGGRGRIGLRARLDGDNVCIEVSDDGRGMTAEERQRMFEPFFTTRADEGGSGIGMAVVRDVVIGHGGTVHVDSELGAGTVVRLVLPGRRP
jgi:signal transduction histidine kinase